MLALAACYTNDIYREATKLGVSVFQVEVEVRGEFPSEGKPASDIIFTARIEADATEGQILDLAKRTDEVAEIHGTVRERVPVWLDRVEAVSRR